MINRKTVIIIAIATVLIIFFIFFETDYKTNEVELTYLPTQKLLDPKKLFDLNFEYIINSSACENSSNILAVIIVTSYFGNVETRSAMRRAFPQAKLQEFYLRRVFLLGTAPDDKYTTQKAILDENRRFGDLVQGNFKEAYRNLTYKHMMGLRWVSQHCKSATFVIKMDDDIVANLYKIIKLLTHLKLPTNKLLAGYVLRGMVPIREPANKWYVTQKEYQSSSYPTFVSGWFYITNPCMCQKFVETSATIPYFWVDDVYVTGLLAQKLRIKHYNLREHFTVHPEFLQCCMRDIEKARYDCEVLIGPNGGDNNLFLNFNEVVSKCFYEQCHKRTRPLNETCVAEKKYPLGRGEGSVESYRLV